MGVPGVALGVLIGGVERTAGFGVTNVEHPHPVDGDTLFHIGSVTKTYTATAIMRLIEKGVIDLEAPVRTYLPHLQLADADVAAQVTIKHLLTHTSGWWGDFFADTGNGDDAAAEYVAQMATLPQITPLGRFFGYNNAGFVLAGRVIEAVTGKPYETAMQELVLGPLGMTRSFFFPQDVITYPFAVGHTDGEKGPTVVRPWALPRSLNAAGGITASISEQLRYARFQMGDGTARDGSRLLAQASMERMHTEMGPGIPTLNDGTGMAWLLQRVGDLNFVWHDGSDASQTALFVMIPERQFAFVLLTNGAQGETLAHPIFTQAVTELLGATLPGAYLGSVPASALDHLQAMPAEQLAAYVGRYSGPNVPGSYAADVLVDSGKLAIRLLNADGTDPGGSAVHVGFTAPDQIVGLDGPGAGTPADFLRTANGTIGWFRFGGRILARQG